MAKKAKKQGRRANQWTLVKFADIAAHIAKTGMAQVAFAKELGITSTTFNNWKQGRSAPNEGLQQAIVAALSGKGGQPAQHRKPRAKAESAAKNQGAKVRTAKKDGSSTLSELAGKLAQRPASATPRPQVRRALNGGAHTSKTSETSGAQVANMGALTKFVGANLHASIGDLHAALDTVLTVLSAQSDD